MADTKAHSPLPVEGDGISYSGIFWFVVILTVVTLVCQLLMFVLLRAFQHQQADAAPASALAPAAVARIGEDGRVYPDLREIGRPDSAQPKLLVNEYGNLADYLAREREILTTYGWVDRNAGTVRIPVDRAKDLLIERGLPVRGQ